MAILRGSLSHLGWNELGEKTAISTQKPCLEENLSQLASPWQQGAKPTFPPPSGVSSLDESSWKPSCKELIHWSMEVSSPCLQVEKGPRDKGEPFSISIIRFLKNQNKACCLDNGLFNKMHTYGTVII